MKTKPLILKVAFFLALFMYELSPGQSYAQENREACYDFESCAPAEIVHACYEQSPNGCIDWENRIIYAVGIGVPNDTLSSASQKNFSAVRAATVVAQRNMLEMIQGVRITSNTTIEMGMAENDTIVSEIEGTVKRVQRIGRPKFLNDGSVSVTVRYFMTDLSTLLLTFNPSGGRATTGRSSGSKKTTDPYGEKSDPYAPKQSTTQSDTPSSASGDAYTGLILNAKGLGVRPALSPKIYDEDGNVIYGIEKTDRRFNLEQGIVGYAKTIAGAENNNRIKGRVLEITAKERSGRNGVDMVIKNSDAKMLSSLYETQSFLREGRVIVIVN